MSRVHSPKNGPRHAALAFVLTSALVLSACNPVPEGHSLLNPPTDTCDLTLPRSEDCSQVNGRFGYGQCTVAPAAVCQGPDGTVVVTFLGDRGIRQVTLTGRATCRSREPVTTCASED